MSEFKLGTVERTPLRTLHVFQSNFANFNLNGRFRFNLVEPIKNIIGARIRACFIGTFATIGASDRYYLLTDAISNVRDATRFNGEPDKIVFCIPNSPSTAPDPIFRINDSDDFNLFREFDLHEVWFELANNARTIINPPDVGWSFTVEIEYLIK